MGFVSFLKEAGLVILRGVQIFEGIKPAVEAYLPAGATAKVDSIDLMIQKAVDVEQTFVSAFGPENKGGLAKLQALVPKVQQVVLDIESISGKQIGDPALFQKAVAGFAQASVDLANSIKNQVKTSDQANAPAPPSTPQPMPPVAKP